MERDIIGAILRKRIAEIGMTQEDFAEKAGIGIATLKKYMRGTTAYNYLMLDKFAEILDCSFDYLLGKTISTRRDIQDIRESTHLNNNSIDMITKQAERLKSNDMQSKDVAERWLESLNAVIEFDLVSSILVYMTSEEERETLSTAVKNAFHSDEEVPMNGVFAYAVVDELSKCRLQLLEQRKKQKPR